jgi:hypothetical protein
MRTTDKASTTAAKISWEGLSARGSLLPRSKGEAHLEDANCECSNHGDGINCWCRVRCECDDLEVGRIYKDLALEDSDGCGGMKNPHNQVWR